jgi:hypothetical protein
MFIIAVLVVIAVGVCVLAATTNQRIYGPSWGHFSVAFTGHVYEYRGHTSVTGGPSGPSAFHSTLTIEFPFEYSAVSSPAISCWVGIVCYPNELDASVLHVSGEPRNVAVQQMGSALVKTDFGAGVPEVRQNANGLSVDTIGPQCTNGQCRGAEVVSNGRVLWYLLAFSKGPVSTVEGFLGSFQPIG